MLKISRKILLSIFALSLLAPAFIKAMEVKPLKIEDSSDESSTVVPHVWIITKPNDPKWFQIILDEPITKYPTKEEIESQPLSNTQVLHLLAGHLEIDTIKKIWGENKALFDACLNEALGIKKQTLLMAAIECGKPSKYVNKEIINFLARSIIENKKCRLVKFLIKHGANLLAQDADGNNCLHLAVKANDAYIINCIIESANKKGDDFFLDLILAKNRSKQMALDLAKIMPCDESCIDEAVVKRLEAVNNDFFKNRQRIYDNPKIESTYRTWKQFWEAEEEEEY